jgi:hypothetical protein
MKRIAFCFVLVFIFISAPLFAVTEANGDQEIKCLHLKTPVLPKTGHCIDDFVPKGWKLIDQTVGDLNKDGLPDIAGVIEEILDDADEHECAWDSHRILFVAFNNGNSKYKLSVQNNDIILTNGEGGCWGDPFNSNYSDQYKHGKNQETGIFINRGSLLIKFYGGTCWRWSDKYRFRYQNKGWYLIGYDYEWYHTCGYKGDDHKISINYLTGKRIEGGNVYNGPDDHPEDSAEWKWKWEDTTSFVRKKKLTSLHGFSP